MAIALPHLRPRRSWLIPVALWAALAVPAVVGMVTFRMAGYWPTGDDALMGLSIHDVFSGHPPVMGPRTTTDSLTQITSHHPGPALAYLWAVPAAVFGYSPAALLMATTTLSCVVCAGIVWAARRVGGNALGLLAVVGTLILVWAVGLQVLVQPFNPYPPVLMTMLFALLCWGLLRSDWALLPAFVIVASVMVQAHVSYVVFVGVVILCAAVASVASVGRDALRQGRRRHGTRPRLIHIGPAVVVGGLAWLPPIIEAFNYHPNNFTQLWRYATSSHGSDIGILRSARFVTRMLAPIPGGFQSQPPSGWGGLGQTGSLAGESIGGMLLLVLLWAAFSKKSWPGRSTGLVRAGTRVAVVGLCAGTAVVAALPRAAAIEPWNYLQVWPAVIVAWMVLALYGILMLGRYVESRSGPVIVGLDSGARHTARVGAGVLAVTVALVAVRSSPANAMPSHGGSGIASAISDLQTDLTANPSVWGDPVAVGVEGDSFTALMFTAPALAYGLALEHDRVFLQRWPSGPEDVDFRNLAAAPDSAATVHVHEVMTGHPAEGRYASDGYVVRRVHDGDRLLDIYLIPAP